MNTDVQALARAPPGVQVVTLGAELTGGLGAGGIADVGRRAAEESLEAINGAPSWVAGRAATSVRSTASRRERGAHAPLTRWA